jgi:hypothetical protein
MTVFPTSEAFKRRAKRSINPHIVSQKRTWERSRHDETNWFASKKQMKEEKSRRSMQTLRAKSAPGPIAVDLKLNRGFNLHNIPYYLCGSNNKGVDKQKQHVEVVKTPALFRGGIARAGIAKPSIWHRNVDELMEEVKMKPEMKKTYHIDFREVHTPVLVRDRINSSAQIMALNFNHISDCDSLVPDGTLFGAWLHHGNHQGAEEIEDFISLKSLSGVSFLECVPNDADHRKSLHTRGQSVVQKGTMIGYHGVNAKNGTKDLPSDEFLASRGAMGPVGGITDKRCKEYLSPALPIVNRVLEAFPYKLKRVAEAITQAFDGSRVLTYLNMLITVGNKDNSKAVSGALEKYPKLKAHYSDKAGTHIHNDPNNGGPAVAIVLGAFDGFDFVYPTCGKRIKAPSGTILVGNMRDLLHGVSGGTGLRLTLVFAQHETGLGIYKPKNGKCRVLSHAKRSEEDVGVKAVARIEGLDSFAFGCAKAKEELEKMSKQPQMS